MPDKTETTKTPWRDFIMCGLYVICVMSAFTLPFPLNLIQGGLCGVLLPWRIYRVIKKVNKSNLFNEIENNK